MASYDYGKSEVIDYIVKLALEKRQNMFTVLDVGACDGKWADMLRAAFEREFLSDAHEGEDIPLLRIDGVEKFKPNAARCIYKYNSFYIGGIEDYWYPADYYDVIIFGDVIEHMEVLQAQLCLERARNSASEVIVGVPYLYRQGAIYGNPYEVHVQHDLTHELFMERYPGFKSLVRPMPNYEYFVKE